MRNNINNQTVLATIKGEEAKRILAALEAGHGFRLMTEICMFLGSCHTE